MVNLYDRVYESCIDRLRDSYSAESGLFSRQLRDGQWQATTLQESITSSSIALIGLSRAAIAPEYIGLAVGKTLDAILHSIPSQPYFGAVGLALWANAVWDGRPLDIALTNMGLSLGDLGAVARSQTTMELAWLVTGLVHEARRTRGASVSAVLEGLVRELEDRYNSSTNLFRHASISASIRHRARTSVANFADQIYSVQALGSFALSSGNGEALELAGNCAAQLVSRQGADGEWWWHYDPRSGRVSQHYPVYSVHQHSMGPMALAAVARAGRHDFSEAIERSIQWIDVNRSGASMVDLAAGTIWRDLSQAAPAPVRRARQLRSLAGWRLPNEASHESVRLNRETRPYEWGWCLFAGAIHSRDVAHGHVV